jgi:hypothetical protein
MSLNIMDAGNFGAIVEKASNEWLGSVGICHSDQQLTAADWQSVNAI